MGAADITDGLEPAEGLPANGDVIAEKYRVERVVGSGGMGVVVAATHLQLGQEVAIKILTADASRRAEATARFLREGRAAAALHSDHVVRIHDVGTLETGAPYMVMELLRGHDLAEYLARHKRLPIGEAARLIIQACDAIADAHDHGVVHRDLKPSNLFLTQRSDCTPQVKVLDFGISKSLPREGRSAYDGTLTATRTVMGSPAYMSPEQVRDTRAVDHRSDVWSLGIILYELVAGGPPFEADTLPAVCAAIAADPPRPLSEHRPEIPPGLEAVVDCCLEKDPARRFQSVRDLAVALKPFACRGDAPLATAEGGGSVPPRDADSAVATLAAAGVQAAPAGNGAPAAAAALSEGAPSSGGTEPTLVSARPPVTLTAAATTTPSALPRRRAVLLGSTLMAAAALAGAVWVMRSAPEAQAPSATAAPPAAVPTATFTLLIESLPSGVEVVENDQRLGTTPLQIAVDADAARTRPRTFVLSLAGYEPYSLVQGFSDSNVRVLASLQRAAEPPAPVASASASAAAPEVAPRAAARWLPTATPRRPDAGSPAATSAPAPDIRLER